MRQEESLEKDVMSLPLSKVVEFPDDSLNEVICVFFKYIYKMDYYQFIC